MDTRTGHPPLGLDTQKKSLIASERDEQQRAEFRDRIAQRDHDDFVIVDETGSNLNLTPRYSRAPRGVRARGRVPRNTPANTTLIASMTRAGMGPSVAFDGATDKHAFEAYVETFLLPSLRAGQVVVLDNLSVHKSSRFRELVEERGCEVWYLPSYSPDLSPIEEAFSKLKTLLRKAQARTKEALLEALGASLSQITAADARGYFAHCGYHPHPL
jgi:transposase